MKSSVVGMLRLANQRVSQAKRAKPQALAAWMGALQAQDLSAVKRALALRLGGDKTERDIDAALARREVLRAWSMRGTIQLVAPQDARWMAELVGARILASARPVHKALGLDEDMIAKGTKLIVKALKGGKVMERQALYELLDAKGISAGGQRGYHLLAHAGLSGVICFGPRADKQPTFALMEEWAPQATKLARQAALIELARRYFRSHGPATLQDFAWWSSLPVTECKQALAAIRPELTEETIEGTRYWLYASEVAEAAGFHLLPAFDEFILGYKDRSAVISAKLAPALSPFKNGIFLPVMVSGGRVVGTWSRTMDKGGVRVEARPFDSMSVKEQRGFKAEAEKYADYLGTKLVKAST